MLLNCCTQTSTHAFALCHGHLLEGPNAVQNQASRGLSYQETPESAWLTILHVSALLERPRITKALTLTAWTAFRGIVWF